MCLKSIRIPKCLLGSRVEGLRRICGSVPSGSSACGDALPEGLGAGGSLGFTATLAEDRGHAGVIGMDSGTGVGVLAGGWGHRA